MHYIMMLVQGQQLIFSCTFLIRAKKVSPVKTLFRSCIVEYICPAGAHHPMS